MILNELSKKDKLWQGVAFNICKDKDLAKNLVQDMYLKIYDTSLKRSLDINDYYIVITIKNMFLDYLKENNKTFSLELMEDLECPNTPFEPTDKEYKALNKLSFLERELLTLKETMSYHEIQRRFNINYQFSRRVILEVKRKNNGKKSSK